MHALAQFGHRVITVLWRLLFALTFFFAATSVNLIIGDNHTFGTSTTYVTTFFILGVVLFVLALQTYPRVRRWADATFITHQVRTASLIFALVVIGQIVFVSFVHPVSGFDSGMLNYAAVSAKHVQEPNIVAYYSLNQNNLPIMLLMRQIVVLTGQTSWQFFDFLTLALVDLSALLNLRTVVILRRQSLGTALYLQAGWLAVFPSILMPYTDAWSIPFVSLSLLGAAVISQRHFSLGHRSLGAALVGVSGAITYFIKPSAIIPLIAMIIVVILTWLEQAHHWTRAGVTLTLCLGLAAGASGAGVYTVANHAVKNQDYIAIDYSRNIPAIHFAAMGIYGQGGYAPRQAEAMAALPTKAQKTAYSKDKLLKRLRQLGPWGYLRFLYQKQRNNTADGTFGWLKEGTFFRENQKPSQKGFANKLKNFIFLYGEHIADFRFLAQVWWVLLLGLIALSWGKQRGFREILRLALLGGFIFLLLFEGGRSRYLIQYLPCFLILATLDAPVTLRHLKAFVRHYRSAPAEAVSETTSTAPVASVAPTAPTAAANTPAVNGAATASADHSLPLASTPATTAGKVAEIAAAATPETPHSDATHVDAPPAKAAPIAPTAAAPGPKLERSNAHLLQDLNLVDQRGADHLCRPPDQQE